jgi:hypothetical protein
VGGHLKVDKRRKDPSLKDDSRENLQKMEEITQGGRTLK